MKVYIKGVWVEQDNIHTFNSALYDWYGGNADAANADQPYPVGNVVCDSYLTQSYHYDPAAAPPVSNTTPQPTMYDGKTGWTTYDSVKYPNDNPIIT